MKRMLFIFVLFLICTQAFSNTYKAFENKKVTSFDGVVGLYDVEGKVYVEIPLDVLEKRFLMGTMVEACSDPLESSVGYQPIVPYAVCFRKGPSSIHLCRLNDSYVKSENLRLGESNIPSVLKSFKFSTNTSSSVISINSSNSSLLKSEVKVYS